MNALENWEKLKELCKTPDLVMAPSVIFDAGDKLAQELKEAKDLLKEAIAGTEVDVKGRVQVDVKSLLYRMRKAVE